MKKFFFAILFLSMGANAADQNIKLLLNWKPEAEFGGIYAAQEEHIFEKHHLKVEVLSGGAGTPSVQMVASSKIDFGIASADEIILAQSHGAKVVALFATYQTNAQGIMTHEEESFKTLADVFSSPNTIAMQKGLPYAMFLMKKYQGYKAQIVPYLGGVSNFLVDKRYSQQVFITSEPLSAEARNQKVKTFLVSDSGYNPYTTVLITRDDVIKEHPALVKELVMAVREGLQAYLDHPEATNIYMNKRNPSLDLETLKKSAQIQKPLIQTAETSKAGIGTMTEARWNELSDQLLEMKMIQQKIPAAELFRNL